MKYEKWTVALAALGVVSLASAVRAEEKPTTAVTALTPTTIGGYVDTSAHWDFGTGSQNPAPYKFNTPSKNDGFNLDVVQITLDKAFDEQPWSAGYHVDLWAGPDANTLRTTSTLMPPNTGTTDFAIRQAYVRLDTPVGNGLDWKIGVFDSIIGYESLDSTTDPNYTRSYGHSMEPQTMTGILASYKFCDMFSFRAGVADTLGPVINYRDPELGSESYKAYMASATLTAPNSLGFLAGSTLDAGFVNGFNPNTIHPLSGGVTNGNSQTSLYVGTKINTPLKKLKVGASFDYVNIHSIPGDTYSFAGYAYYEFTEKLSLALRAEIVKDSIGLFSQHYGVGNDVNEGPAGAVDPSTSSQYIMAYTATEKDDLWKNVVSRVELRWDHSCDNHSTFGGETPGSPGLANSWLLAANIAYLF